MIKRLRKKKHKNSVTIIDVAATTIIVGATIIDDVILINAIRIAETIIVAIKMSNEVMVINDVQVIVTIIEIEITMLTPSEIVILKISRAIQPLRKI